MSPTEIEVVKYALVFVLGAAADHYLERKIKTAISAEAAKLAQSAASVATTVAKDVTPKT